MSRSTHTSTCYPRLLRLSVIASGIALALGQTAFAQLTCLQDEYSKVNKQKLNCTANDVSIAQVTNIRDPKTMQPLTTCYQGTKFNFLADFEIKTTSSQARENIGLYVATDSTTQALTGACADNIISKTNSDNPHETDAPPDNCGDTSSNDYSKTINPLTGSAYGAGVEVVTLEIDGFMCDAPAGSTTLVLPNCTSWQIPGGTIQCVSNPDPTTGLYPYPFNGPGGTPTAIPGSPSKCNCGVISLPITPVTAKAIVQKACTTTKTPGPATFTQVNPAVPNSMTTQSPTTCDAGAEGSTVTYTVSVTNTSSVGGLVIDQVCDDQYGAIFRSSSAGSDPTKAGYVAACLAGTSGIAATNGNCPPGPLAAAGQSGATGTCTFTAPVGENLSGLTDTVTVSGHSSLNPSSTITQGSNSVTVTSTDAPSTATTTKGYGLTTAGCATVRYTVDVENTSTADEVLSLSALNDSQFGDLTACTNANCTLTGTSTTVPVPPPQIVGTTCGVVDGLGTLAGTGNGAGTLSSVSLGVSKGYKCQFDAQFCSGLDTNGCFSNTDKVTATLAGDESEAVTVKANSLTVKECFAAATVTSTSN